MEYHNIVFMNDYEMDESMQQALEDEDTDALLGYLKQWDYAGESEHSPTDNPPWGSNDRTEETPAYDDWTYTLSWSTGYGYASLTRWRDNDNI